jgi:hypothetical protein
MERGKNYNGLLVLGIVAIISGLSLLMYCIASYSEIKLVTDKIDFDELDNNIHISTSDKYYKHLSIWDTLNKKLEKNKNLPIKNMSCGYLDYAQHNIKSLYKLVYKSANEDSTRRSVVEGNIKSLQEMYKSYKSCRKTALYQDELDKMLAEIENADDIFYQGRMETFLTGKHEIEKVDDSTVYSGEEITYPLSYDEQSGSASREISAQNNRSANTNSQTIQQEEQYKQVEKYIEPSNQRQEKNNESVFYGQP